jgi:hypothetical protein
VHKRTAAQTLTDIGGQAALTNPVTGTGSAGQVSYWSSGSAITGESNLFWDATNDRLGIGTNSPNANLDIQRVFGDSNDILRLGSNQNYYFGFARNTSTGALQIQGNQTGFNSIILAPTSGNVLIGTTTDSGGKLRVDGDVFINNNSNTQIGFNTTGALNSVGAYLYFNRSGSNKWTAGMGPFDGSDDYQIVTGSTKALNLTVSTGAAIFSSNVTANSFIKSGGTSSQFLKADGSVDSTTYVPTSRTITINGTTEDLSADRTYNVGTVTSITATAGTGISISGSPITTSGTLTITNTAPDQVVSLTASTGISISGTYPNFTITNTSPSSGGTVTSVASLTLGTSGTDLTSTVANGTTTPAITLNVPTASATNRGALSSTDWTTFNNKQNTLTLTTSGTSGAATLVGSTLNIPNYSADLSGYLPLTGGTLTGGLGGTTASFSSTVSATQFFVNTSGQSRAISTFHPTGAFGSNIWIGGGGANSTLGGGASSLGSTNTSLGVFALEDNTTGRGNVAIGYLSLSDNTTGYTNTSVGQFSMWKNTTGYINSAFGKGSLADNTTGYANSAFGNDSLGHITTGRENVAIGFWSGYFINSGEDNTTSDFSVYLGADTRASANGNTNEIVIGAGGRGQGSNSAVIGNDSITKTILRGNVGIGTASPTMTLSIRGDKQGDANEGQGQLLIDGNSAYNASNGSTLSASGAGSVIIFRGKFNTAGSFTGLAGISGSKENTTDGNYGGNLRFYTRTNGGDDQSERMRITSVGHTQPGADNAYSLGVSGTRWSAVWAANGTIQTSDEREKKDILDSDLGLDLITKLRPVSFKWKVGQNVVTSEVVKDDEGNPILDEEGNEKTESVITPREGKRTHYGLIAQEVEELLNGKDFGGFIYDEETDTKGLRYDQFVPLLIKAIQELKTQVDTLKN